MRLNRSEESIRFAQSYQNVSREGGPQRLASFSRARARGFRQLRSFSLNQAAEGTSPPSREVVKAASICLNRQLRHLRIAAPFGEQRQGDPMIAGALGPSERQASRKPPGALSRKPWRAPTARNSGG